MISGPEVWRAERAAGAARTPAKKAEAMAKDFIVDGVSFGGGC